MTYKLLTSPTEKSMATSSKLFLKRPREAGRIEMSVEGVSNLTVEQLKDKVATTLSVPQREFRE